MSSFAEDQIDKLTKDCINIIEQNPDLFTFIKYLSNGVKNLYIKEKDAEFILNYHLLYNIGIRFIVRTYFEKVHSIYFFNELTNMYVHSEKVIVVNTLFNYLTDRNNSNKLHKIVKEYFK